MNKLSWYYVVPSLLPVSIFGIGRYSAGYQSRKANTIVVTNPLIDNAVLPATYTRGMVAKKLVVETNQYLSPLYKITPIPNAAWVTKNLRLITPGPTVKSNTFFFKKVAIE